METIKLNSDFKLNSDLKDCLLHHNPELEKDFFIYRTG